MGHMQVSALLALSEGVRWQGTQQGEGGASVSGEDRDWSVLPASYVQQFCRKEGLSPFMVPRVVLAQHQPLPTNASGKVLKQEVRRRILQMLEHPQPPQSRM